MNSRNFNTSIKPIVFLLCLLPALVLAIRLWLDKLGANPIDAIADSTGEWTLRFLLIALLMTPLQKFLKWRWPTHIRRMLGLFAFFYATLHLITYLWLDQFFEWGEIWRDIVERPFIAAGVAAYLLLVPLALTSNKPAMRMLGKRWKPLHRLAYIATLLGVLHYWWMASGKSDVSEPMVYALLLGLLLLVRVRLPTRT
ncbi:sulfite oxidase heme-binding subunit YedZ [Biformimicrobium ophioploci]|uniref:Protein-methionine-sulfoxide reductase heme-binding subunit MsrQ n=1 Tax=Biformimicrobium ophioploci TaxID=3036711 RepID=A0ABQ6M146_9GAMM|nr:protein-methionine-sulfoxide reductase heme-binding subunit MsrQ [Microbulbifer sp. NKW57]GMG88017.1 sulfoxide reductase heme-binding subunit YedZ [Microbulbifer sp. NKW57]